MPTAEYANSMLGLITCKNPRLGRMSNEKFESFFILQTAAVESSPVHVGKARFSARVHQSSHLHVGLDDSESFPLAQDILLFKVLFSIQPHARHIIVKATVPNATTVKGTYSLDGYCLVYVVVGRKRNVSRTVAFSTLIECWQVHNRSSLNYVHASRSVTLWCFRPSCTF